MSHVDAYRNSHGQTTSKTVTRDKETIRLMQRGGTGVTNRGVLSHKDPGNRCGNWSLWRQSQDSQPQLVQMQMATEHNNKSQDSLLQLVEVASRHKKRARDSLWQIAEGGEKAQKKEPGLLVATCGTFCVRRHTHARSISMRFESTRVRRMSLWCCTYTDNKRVAIGKMSVLAVGAVLSGHQSDCRD